MAASQSEARRAEKHTKARQQMMDEYERQRTEMAAAAEKNSKLTAAERFTSKTESIEETLKKETIGLVSAEDFKKRREALEELRQREAARTDELKAEERKAKKKSKKEPRPKLSFAMDDEEEKEEEEEGKDVAGGAVEARPATKKAKASHGAAVATSTSNGASGGANGASASTSPGLSTSGRMNLKNPSVDTSFLPDRQREERERRLREELRQEWLRKQEAMKGETIEITYSFWDGSGHRKSVMCKKGDSIASFLDKCRQQFPELQRLGVDSLMYIKEDLIIPHHYTFYDFIVSKARGKSGPLFNFDVHDDVRLLADASVEKDESHAGKVVERTWYNRNKHIFPASRWELYEPNKDYGSYTIHDRSKEQ